MMFPLLTILLRCGWFAGLNISLDSLRADRFEQLTRRRGHHKVLESIHTAAQLGFDPVKVGAKHSHYCTGWSSLCRAVLTG
jgi:hypothetical protein